VVEFEVVISATTKNADGIQQFMTGADFVAKMLKTGEIEFDLTAYFNPAPIERLRCRAVGLSHVLVNPPEAATTRFHRASAVVFPPPAPDPFSDAGALIPRAPVIVAEISIADPSSPPPLMPTVGVTNINPKGKWVVKIAKSVWYPDNAPDGVSGRKREQLLRDIRLHLHLVGAPKKSSTDWGEVPW
jgi:hypothetical protein